MTAFALFRKFGKSRTAPLATLIIILSLLLVRDVDAHFLDMTQAWLYFDDATINMIATRASNNDLPLIRKDDELGLIFKAYPDQGTTFGMGGYITFYPPEGTQVIDASYAFPDNSGNLIDIPIKSQSPVPHSAGSRGADTIPELIGVSFGSNILGQEIIPVAPTGTTLGTLAGVSADTGIFYSTDPLTSWKSWHSSSYCSNPAGNCTVKNQLGTATNPNNAWDAYQLLAYGSTGVGADVSIPADPNGGTAYIDPSGHGSTARGLANPVAGPESGYAWQFNLDVWDGSGSVANFIDSVNDVGPWQRIQYPGSAISSDLPGGNGDLYALVGVDGSTTGLDLDTTVLPATLDHDDPTSTKAIRWSVGGIQKGRHEYARVTLKILANPGEPNAPFDANGCFEAHAEAFAGDAGYTDTNKDHIYRYYDPNTVTLNPCSLLIKRTDRSTYPNGGTIPYQIMFLNLGTTTTLTGVQITDALPQPLVVGSSTDGTLTYYSGGPQSVTVPVSATNPYTWNLPNVPPGGIFEATLQMQAINNGTIINTANGSGSFGTTSVTEVVQVGAIPVLFLNKSVSPTEVAPGGTVAYTIAVDNEGSGPSDSGQPITVADFLPDGFTYISVLSATLNGSPVSPAVSGTATDPIFTVTGPINAGNSLMITFEAVVNVNTPVGTYGNDGELTYQDPIVGTSRLTLFGAAPVKVAASSIGDTIYYDWNGDGVQDPEEEGIPNVVLQLELPGGSTITTTTDASGYYLFPSLPSGTYTVTVQSGIPGSFSLTYDPQGAEDGQAVVTVGAEDAIRTIDFGYKPAGSGSIGDFVFIDSNGDGNPAGETGIDGVIVYLYEDTDGNGVIDPGIDQLITTTTTTGEGGYSFTGLAEGFDYITYVDPFDPAIEAALGTGAYGATTTNPQSIIDLSGSYLDADFGFQTLPPAAIGDQLFIDVDEDGIYTFGVDTPIPDVDVELYYDANGNGLLDPGEPLLETTTSDVNGQYQFGDLPPGSYIVNVVTSDPDVPDGFAPSANELTVTLAAGETNTDIDFPFVPLISKSVSDATASPGDTITYTVNIQYPGSELLQNVVVSDVVPAGVTYLPGSANGGASESGGVVTWNLGSNDIGLQGFDNGTIRVTDNFTVTADNWLSEKDMGRNYGIATSLMVDPRSGENGRPVLKFNLNTIPANATINLALLELEQTVIGDSAVAEPIEVRALTSSWDEGVFNGNNGTSNWNNRTAAATWSTAGGDFNGTAYATTSAPDTLGEVEWNITGLVQAWVDGSLTNNGLLLRAVNEANADKFEHIFSSREGLYPPVIYIEYDIPNGPPRTTRLNAAPTLVSDGQTIEVAMTLRATGVVTNVTPSALTVVATGGAAASCGTASPAGPVDIPADTDVLFTYSCTVSAGTTAGKLTFRGSAANPLGWNFTQATSNSVLVVPPLTFAATIDTPPSTTTIINSAVLADQNTIDPTTSNPVTTTLQAIIGDTLFYDLDGDGLQDPGEAGIPGVTMELTLPGGGTITTTTDASGVYYFGDLPAGTYTVTVLSGAPSGATLTADPDPLRDGATTLTLNTGELNLTADFGYKPQLISKTVSANDANPGDTLTYTITASYPFDGALVNARITDTVPTGTSYVPASATMGGSESSGVVTWNLGSTLAGVPAYQPSASTTITLTATKDTFLDIGNAGRNNGGSTVTELKIRRKSDGSTDIRPLLQWDLSSLPAGAIIDSATFRLNVTRADNANEVTGIFQLNKSWVEGTQNNANCTAGATWNDPDCSTLSGLSWSGPGAEGDYTATAVGTFNTNATGYQAIGGASVTSLVQGWYAAPAGNRGILIKGTSNLDKDVRIGSRSNAGKEPLLVITYHIPGTGTTLSAAPAMVKDGEIINVTMSLTATETISNVAPGSLTVNDASGNGNTATSCSGPSPASASVAPGTATIFTWSCSAETGGAIGIGQLRFTAGASGGGVTFPSATSDSVIAVPPLSFQALINNPPAVGLVENSAFLTDDTVLDSIPSNKVITSLGDLGAIGDRVWLDEDGDGIQDAGEDGLGNITVRLKDSNGVVIATTTTGADGSYLFPNLVAGDYSVEIDSTSLAAGLAANPTYDEDGTGTAHTTAVTLLEGQEYATADFGYNWVPTGDATNPAASATGAIGDFIWNDADGDGVQDPGESGLPNVTVTLFGDPDGDGIFDTVITTVDTDATGHYIFDGIAPGAYVVGVDTVDLPAGFSTTPTGDPDGDGNNVTGPIVLAPGDVYVNADFGYQNSGSSSDIGDTIFIDSNGDGVVDPGEPGIPGVTVNLLDSSGNVIATTTTDENGSYLFPDLPAGTYSIQISDTQNVLGELVPISDPDGGLDNLSSLTVNGTSDDLDQDFGYAPLGHDPSNPAANGLIGDIIFLDTDNSGTLSVGEGLEGVTVYLYDATGTSLLATTTTDENGNYTFGGLDPTATYVVRVDSTTLPAGGTGLSNTIDPDNGTAGESTVDLSAGSGINLDQDFGYATLIPNTLSGTVWTDSNADGTLNGAESGDLAGVTVVLRDASGNIVATALTDANGNYSFANLPDGTYTVDVTDAGNVLAGYWHSDGPNDGSDSNSQDDPYTVTLSGGEANATADFGYYRDPAAIGNRVWFDVNGDGVQDPTEPGLAGIPVTLTVTYPNGAVITVNTTTDASGEYSFDNLLLDESFTLADGSGSTPTYAITVATPAGMSPSPSNTGGNDLLDSDGSGAVATVTMGTADPSYDFGFTATADLGDLPNDGGGPLPDFETQFGLGAAHILFPDTNGDNQPEAAGGRDAIWLGLIVDGESNGLPTAGTDGDDNDGYDDEDGLVLAPEGWVAGGSSTLSVTLNSSGATTASLGIWVDWNGDGSYDDFYPVSGTSVNGPTEVPVTINVPAGYTAGSPAYFRVRAFEGSFSPTAADSGGTVINGEVEDNTVTFSPTAITMRKTGAGSEPAVPFWLWLLTLSLASFSLALLLDRQRLFLRN